jgi:hypothetical protein
MFIVIYSCRGGERACQACVLGASSLVGCVVGRMARVGAPSPALGSFAWCPSTMLLMYVTLVSRDEIQVRMISSIPSIPVLGEVGVEGEHEGGWTLSGSLIHATNNRTESDGDWVRGCEIFAQDRGESSSIALSGQWMEACVEWVSTSKSMIGRGSEG